MEGDSFEFRILGRVEAYRSGRRIPLGRRRERCLLGILLLEAGRPIPTDRLITLLWAEDPPTDPRSSLHTHMSRLRRHLTPPERNRQPPPAERNTRRPVRLLARHSGYLAEVNSEAVDAHRFTELTAEARRLADPAERASRLRDALAMWRGPLLADVADERLRKRIGAGLTELRLAVLMERIDADLATGQHQRLIGELTTLAAEHPDRESFTGQLMVALYRSGRQSEAIESYQRLRQWLADSLGTDPAPELQGLYTAILRQAPELAAVPAPAAITVAVQPRETSPDSRPPPSTPPVLRQLPPDTGEFVGRERELRTQHAAVREGLTHPRTANNLLIFTIEGMAGVGKTRLAIRLAHELVADGHYPDGQLYVDLCGFTPGQGPADPAPVLEEFLSQLGVDRAEIPAGLSERSAMYRDRLADRQVLVLLDNAADEKQVQPLLPAGPDSLVLITSRRTLALDGARPITLRTFGRPEALRLLASIAGRHRVEAEPQAADEVITRCGGLPIAVALAAHRLRARPAWRLADLAARLDDERGRLSELSAGDRAVEVVFALSYRALDSDQRRIFRRLALHPGTGYTAEAAAVLGQTTVQHAEALLGQLLSEHLLLETTPGRYRFHDLVRAYALRRAQADEPEGARAAALDRLLRWYLHTADSADRALDPSRRRPEPTAADDAGAPVPLDHPEAAMAWFEAERTNLVAVAETCVSHGADDVAWQLSSAMLTFLYVRSHFTEWLAVHRTALGAARRSGNRVAEAGVLNRLGVAHSGLHRQQEAIACYRRALRLQQDADDRPGRAWTLNNLGVAYSDLAEYREALDCFRTAVALFAETDDHRGEGLALANLADTHRRLGRGDDAEDCLRRALAVQTRSGDRPGLRFTRTFLGDLRHDRGEYGRAVAEYRTALDIHRELGDRRGAASLLVSLGRTLRRDGQVEAARECWRQALSGYDEIRDPRAAQVRHLLREEFVGPTG
ncbi:tetratricopeptide repeat protein [Plantactinospora sp. B5E13]|uniref:AfsR/SARP family transcriptional regulator n=1 Tax=Plantactinospora sp. B5E13 TaxID=3153758 RepID=UPI00325E5B1A